MRIELPCRGIQCDHNRCFDGATYLELQMQAPEWKCPICDKSLPYEHLAVDE